MPASVPFGFYQGARSEYLATYLLSRLSIVNPVPREGDFGLDLICHLVDRRKTLLHVGAPFSLQVKTEGVEVVYIGDRDLPPEERREICWLLDQTIPLLVGMVSRDDQCLRVYTTWPLHQVRYQRGYDYSRIELIPGKESTGRPGVEIDRDVARVRLGPPILDLSPDLVEDSERADALTEVLKYWVHLDMENYVNSLANVCYVRGHMIHASNTVPEAHELISISGGEISLPGFRKRLAEVLTVTAHALARARGPEAMRPLVEAMRFVEEDLNPVGKELLGH